MIMNPPQDRTLVDAWLKQNGMGPEEIQRYFDINDAENIDEEDKKDG